MHTPCSAPPSFPSFSRRMRTREARLGTRLTGRRVSDNSNKLFAKWMQVMCTGLKMVSEPSILQVKQLLTLVSVFTASRTQTAGLINLLAILNLGNRSNCNAGYASLTSK